MITGNSHLAVVAAVTRTVVLQVVLIRTPVTPVMIRVQTQTLVTVVLVLTQRVVALVKVTFQRRRRGKGRLGLCLNLASVNIIISISIILLRKAAISPNISFFAMHCLLSTWLVGVIDHLQ